MKLNWIWSKTKIKTRKKIHLLTLKPLILQLLLTEEDYFSAIPPLVVTIFSVHVPSLLVESHHEVLTYSALKLQFKRLFSHLKSFTKRSKILLHSFKFLLRLPVAFPLFFHFSLPHFIFECNSFFKILQGVINKTYGLEKIWLLR